MLINILKKAIEIHPQQYELMDIKEFDRRIQFFKNRIIEEQSLSKVEFRNLVNYYRLKINHFSSIDNYGAIHEVMADYRKWKKLILQVGKQEQNFDIFTVSPDEIVELQELFEETIIPLSDEDINLYEEAEGYVVTSDGIWGGLDESILIKEASTRLNIYKMRHECKMKKGVLNRE